MPTPTLSGKVTLDTAQYEAAMRRVQKMGTEAAERVAKSFVGAGAQIAVIAQGIDAALSGIKSFATGIAQAYELGNSLAHAAARTGILASQIAILNQAAKANGIENLTGTVNKMQRSLEAVAQTGKGPAAAALQTLHLNVANLLRLQPTEQLQAIGTAINGLADPAERSATAMALFGRAGAELLPLFENGNALGEAAQTLGRQAAILGDNARGFQRVAELLQSAGVKLQGFFVGAAAELESKLLPLLERFDKIDLAGIGRQFGDGIIKGVNLLVGVFQHPEQVLGIFADGIQANARDFVNVLIAGFRYVGDVFMATFNAMPGILRNVVEGLGFGLLAAGEKLEATLLRGIGKGIQVLAAGIDWVANFGIEKLSASLLTAAAGFARSLSDAIASPARAALSIAAELAVASQGGGSSTLESVLAGVVHGQGLSLGASALDKTSAANAERAQASFGAARGAALQAASQPRFQVLDEANAGEYHQRVRSGVARLEAQGKQTVDGATATQSPRLLNQPGYGPGQRMPVGPRYAAQLRELYGPEKANEMMYDRGTAEMLNNQQQPAVSAGARGEMVQRFGTYAAAQMLTDKGQLKPEFAYNYGTGLGSGATVRGWTPSMMANAVGGGTALDFDPSTRPGWTGAKNAVTQGGLSGGSYGRHANVLTQLSGRVGAGTQDHAATTAKNTGDLLSEFRKTWGSGESGGGGGGGGATTTR